MMVKWPMISAQRTGQTKVLVPDEICRNLKEVTHNSGKSAMSVDVTDVFHV